MREPERARIAAQAGEPLEQCGVGGAREQHRQQRVFLRTRGIDLVDVAGGAWVFRVKIGAQNRAAHAGRGFDRQHAFSRHTCPIRDRWLRNAYFTRKRADTAGSANRLVETYIPHRRQYFL